MMFPLVVDLTADPIPVGVTCGVLGFSKQAFYQWREDPVSQRDWDYAQLINVAIHLGQLAPTEFRDTPPSRSHGLIGPYPSESTEPGADLRRGATHLHLSGRAPWADLLTTGVERPAGPGRAG